MPKCENIIWIQLPARTRVSDAKLQATQQILLAAINCQLEVTNRLVNSKALKELLKSALDGLSLSWTASYEMKQRRRDAIKPQFNRAEFAKGLCSANNPADEFLFGGDTSKRVKEITELQKSRVYKGYGTPITRGRNRFVPYSREYRRGRGRGARTSTYTSPSGYQQPEVNKKPTKTPNNWYVNNSKLLDVVNAQKPFVAGRTNQCLQLSEGVKLTTDPEILDVVKHCHIELSQDPFLFSIHGQRNFNSGQQGTVRVNEEVDKLLDLGVVSPSRH